MTAIFLVVGIVLALGILVLIPKIKTPSLRGFAAVGALLLFLVFFTLSSIRHISPGEVGIVTKHLFGPDLKGTRIFATEGEMGLQADVLAPGWHLWYWPIVYDVKSVPLVDVQTGQVGIIEARDGLPLEPGQVIAAEWPQTTLQQMLDARYFLTRGGGQKGTQASVLTPGKYRLNTELFKVTMVPQTEVLQGEVAVLKSNFGRAPSVVVLGAAGLADAAPAPGAPPPADGERLKLAAEGEMGVRAAALPPGRYPLNTQAYTVVEMWTTQIIAHYTAGRSDAVRPGAEAKLSETEEREITVRTNDGFTFPVDVRVEYVIDSRNAPVVVAKLGDDEGDRFRNALNSAVRAIFRNNAEGVKALDYVQQRSHQEQQSLTMLAAQMARFGVTVTAVRIGNVGDEKTLGTLLKTQTDREIAKQEQLTFQEQQKAAEQQKLLSKATQESEEEKRLATASYAAKIAEETKKQKITEASAEAESITIRAKAQADAYRLVAEQIGKGNAALVEILKIVGERGIQIAPRVMVTGGSPSGPGKDPETTALIGTMLDTMISKDDTKPPVK